MSKAIQQYLAIYAEPESRQLTAFPNIQLDHSLVIPCFRETPAFAERLQSSLMTEQKILGIVVINQPPGPVDPLNKNLLHYFCQLGIAWQSAGLTLFRAATGESYWLVVDRFSDGLCINKKLGVGLARKIGCDIAVQLIEKGVCGNKWVYTSDADAHLPQNYFTPFATTGNSSAAVFATKHTATSATLPSVLAATQLYEQALGYYVRGLTWAGSPYNFPTIGSAMAVCARAYCQARGFPKRSGGEDFYLLNKLAKLGSVARVNSVCVEIEARVSDRVPFGTGPAVEKILALENPADFTYYAPEVFTALKSWMERIPNIWPALQSRNDPLQGLHSGIVAILAESGIATLWEHLLKQVNSAPKCEAAVHHWFDAFRTLKFIRQLQETQFPAAPLAQSLRTAEFMRDALS